MEPSALIVVALGTLLFIGFPVWMALYSRRKTGAEPRNETE
ncbi:MAG TPA: hypothetical protein VJV05_14470 [Pyrinomonadaceae bacterium]|nr:hypothetical protein [Pyrinomonadaceae bacterium]